MELPSYTRYYPKPVQHLLSLIVSEDFESIRSIEDVKVLSYSRYNNLEIPLQFATKVGNIDIVK